MSKVVPKEAKEKDQIVLARMAEVKEDGEDR